MDMAVPVELDQLFDRARTAMEVERWNIMDAPDSQDMQLELSRLELSRDVALIRSQYMSDNDLATITTIAQPEVYFNPEREPNDFMVATGIERLMAPGDAVVWVQTGLTPLVQRTASLIGTMQPAALGATTFRLRQLVRRDFPKLGCITILAAPLDPDSNVIVEEWGVVKATVVIAQSCEDDPCKTRIMEVQQLTRVPLWAVPMAAPQHFRMQMTMVNDYINSEAYKEVTEGAGRYIVVGIRRCLKGPPLLPRENTSASDVKVTTDWLEAETSGSWFGLPEYLSMFLSRIGVQDADIFDRLHGRQVVRYQAVVQLRAWQRAWALLETPFRIQRTAYRRLHGGSNAPDITIDMKPKFLALEESTYPRPTGDDTPATISVPSVRTFIHFSESTTKTRLSGYDPAYIDLPVPAMPSGRKLGNVLAEDPLPVAGLPSINEPIAEPVKEKKKDMKQQTDDAIAEILKDPELAKKIAASPKLQKIMEKVKHNPMAGLMHMSDPEVAPFLQKAMAKLMPGAS